MSVERKTSAPRVVSLQKPNWRKAAWLPYLFFLIVVASYAAMFLADGYSPSMDEGFLQSVAQRVVNGETLYRDFHYWRTPLSVYTQAAMIWMLGDSYTILAARIYCLLQLVGLTLLISQIYRKLVTGIELFLLLCASFTLTSMLLNFPWYNYDAVFCAGVALYFAYRRRWFWSGVFVALAILAKQNYALLVPLFFAGSLIVWLINRRNRILTVMDAGKMFAGLVAPLGVYGGWLLATGRFGEFINQTYVYPSEAQPVSLQFAFFQDHATAFSTAWPYLAVMAGLLLLKPIRWMVLPAALVVLVNMLRAPMPSVDAFSYIVVMSHYGVALAALAGEIWYKRRSGNSGVPLISVALLLGIAIQYLSGFNMSGLFFASIGAGVALPAIYLTIRNWDADWSARAMAGVYLILILICAGYFKHTYIYHEYARAALTSTYTWPKLAGIHSEPGRVAATERMLNAIDQNSSRGDYIFVYPNYSSLYYLSDRRNPTGIDWYYRLGLVQSIVDSSLHRMNAYPPRLILIDSLCLSPYLDSLVSNHYQKIDSVESIWIYRSTSP